MKPREGIILLMDINCPFQKVPEQVLLPALGLLGFARGNFSCSLSKDTKVLLLWGESGVPHVVSGCSSLAGGCVLLVSHVLPALAARGEKLISGHWFWLHLQGNFIHRQLPVHTDPDMPG